MNELEQYLAMLDRAGVSYSQNEVWYKEKGVYEIETTEVVVYGDAQAKYTFIVETGKLLSIAIVDESYLDE